MKQGGSKNSLFGRLPTDRRLCSCRSGPAGSLDFPWIAIPSKRRELLSCRGTEQPLERPSRCLCQLPDSQQADLGQPRLRDRPHSPHQLDGQVVKKFQLGVGIDDHQPVRLGHLRSNFCQMLGARYTDRDRKAKLRPNSLAVVADFAANAAVGLPQAAITATGRRTRSAASVGSRSS